MIGTEIDAPPVEREFSDVVARFDDACRARPELLCEHHFQFAGQPVHLRVLGPALAEDLAAPFAHLAAQDASTSSALRIDVWHEAEHGAAAARGGSALSLGPYGHVAGPYGNVTGSADGRYMAVQRPYTAAWLDRRAWHIVAWVSSSDRLHLDERARPFHRVLAVACGDRGVHFAHAGLVATDGKGALFVGKGGSGKSTCSMTCLIEGMDYLGDDFVGVSVTESGRYVGNSLYGSAVLGLGHTQRYPVLTAASRPAHHAYEDKSLIDLAGLGAGRLVSAVDIRAVVLPRVAGTEHTTFRPASSRDALIGLAPSSLMLVGSRRKALDRFADLTAGVPGFWLDLGRDLGQIAPKVRELLASV